MLNVIAFLLIGTAFLIPNSFVPWTTFWLESSSFAGLAILIYIFTKSKSHKISLDIAICAIAFFSIIFIDFLFRKDTFIGDYVLGILYGMAFFSATFVGQNTKKQNIFFFAVISASIISTVLATLQWSQPGLNHLYIREVPLGGRAFANTGQPNHLSTLLVMGLLAIYALQYAISFLTKHLLIFIICFGIALTQSRTGILQVLVSSILLAIMLPGTLRQRIIFLFPLTALLACTLLTSYLSDFLAITSNRNTLETGLQSLRLQHWLSMLEAIKHNIWWGIGWLGTAKAHLHYSINPAQEGVLSYSHNIFLDFFVWFGLIGGTILTTATSRILFSFFKCKSNYTQKICWIAFTNFIIHSSLEYPFAYLHILIPAGIFFGISLSDGKNNYSISKNLIIANVVILSSTGFIIFFSVIKITPEIQYLRFNHAKIISTQDNYTTNYSIIDQLESQVRTYYKQPSENISTDELEKYEKSADRFSLAQIVFHAALANKYIGNEKKAEFYMRKLCEINKPVVCLNYRNKYKTLTES